MASRALGIVDAAVAALSAVGKPTGSSVRRMRSTPAPQDRLPLYTVYLGDEASTGRSATGRVTRRIELFVDWFVEVPNDEDADRVVDEGINFAWAQMTAGEFDIGGSITGHVDADGILIRYGLAEQEDRVAVGRMMFPIEYDQDDQNRESVG